VRRGFEGGIGDMSHTGNGIDTGSAGVPPPPPCTVVGSRANGRENPRKRTETVVVRQGQSEQLVSALMLC